MWSYYDEHNRKCTAEFGPTKSISFVIISGSKKARLYWIANQASSLFLLQSKCRDDLHYESVELIYGALKKYGWSNPEQPMCLSVSKNLSENYSITRV